MRLQVPLVPKLCAWVSPESHHVSNRQPHYRYKRTTLIAKRPLVQNNGDSVREIAFELEGISTFEMNTPRRKANHKLHLFVSKFHTILDTHCIAYVGY